MRRWQWEEVVNRLEALEDTVDTLTRQVRRIGRYVPRRVDEAAQNGKVEE